MTERLGRRGTLDRQPLHRQGKWLARVVRPASDGVHSGARRPAAGAAERRSTSVEGERFGGGARSRAGEQPATLLASAAKTPGLKLNAAVPRSIRLDSCGWPPGSRLVELLARDLRRNPPSTPRRQRRTPRDVGTTPNASLLRKRSTRRLAPRSKCCNRMLQRRARSHRAVAPEHVMRHWCSLHTSFLRLDDAHVTRTSQARRARDEERLRGRAGGVGWWGGGGRIPLRIGPPARRDGALKRSRSSPRPSSTSRQNGLDDAPRRLLGARSRGAHRRQPPASTPRGPSRRQSTARRSVGGGRADAQRFHHPRVRRAAAFFLDHPLSGLPEALRRRLPRGRRHRSPCRSPSRRP